MATLRDIKRKIGSINSTQTITRTMKMVSASKLRRAQEDLEKINNYAQKIEELTERLIGSVTMEGHPLLTPREEIKKILIVSIASDRGLCGGFNVNISLQAENFIIKNKDMYERIGVYAFGRKVRDYLRRRKIDIVKNWVDIKEVGQGIVNTIADELISLYEKEEFDKIFLSYTQFHTPARQSIIFEEFLPIQAGSEIEPIDYLYEPDKEKIIDDLIPKYISTKIYYAILNSQTSEHASRMNAMENATSSCAEMISSLNLIYNKRRQESITNEMMDIVGGAEALRGT